MLGVQGSASEWWAYLECLPQWIPIPWVVLSELHGFAEVQHEATVQRMRDILAHSRAMWESSRQETIANATWPQFAWALSMVYTHAYSLPYK